VIQNCVVENLDFVDGIVTQCVLNGTVTLSTQEDAHFLDCWSGIPGLSTPIIDLGGTGSNLAMRNYNGGITLRNKTGTESVSIDLNSGQVVVDDTVTNGDIVLRGIGTWTNELTYAGGATIVNQLINPADAQHVAFDGVVTVDTTSSNSGTTYPAGTGRQPVNNLTDAASIAAAQGLNTIYFISDATIGTEADWTGFNFVGQGQSRTTITVSGAATTTGIKITDATVQGIISGASADIVDSKIGDLTIHSGHIRTTEMDDGTLTLTGSSADELDIVSSYSYNYMINNGGDGPGLYISRHSGDLTLENKTGSSVALIGTFGGVMTLDSTVSAGTIDLTGIGNAVDNSTGTAVVNDYLVSNDAIVAAINNNTYDGESFSDILQDLLAMASGRIAEGPSNTFKFYERDNATVRYTLIKSATERTRV
jgi:hypothetical protein